MNYNPKTRKYYEQLFPQTSFVLILVFKESSYSRIILEKAHVVTIGKVI